MGLSHRVTEILEGVRDLTFVAFKMIPVSTTKKSNILPVSVDSTVGGIEIVPANPNRIKVRIQNLGTQPVILNYGGIPTTSDLDGVLAGGSGIRTGDGGTVTEYNWKGQIKGLTETGSTIISVFEEEVDT